MMTTAPLTIEPNANSQRSLKMLCRAISFSEGEFSLMFAHCNDMQRRQELIRQLKETSPVPVREMILPRNAQTLYTSICHLLNGQRPSALTISGLESVESLDEVLISANFVREEFRKHFPFPLIVWVTDRVLQKIIRLAPDLESWAMLPIDFTHPQV